MNNEQDQPSVDFVRQIVAADIATNKNDGNIVTRFPPEPNGYLHIGHAKSICLNFGIAAENGGVCHLRFDDTNPCKEENEFVQAIKKDIRWLGFDWGEHEYYASNYYQQLYDWALKLINAGKAFVDDLTAEEIRKYRGTLTEPGSESPHRNRSVSENIDLFERMKAGEFEDGQKVLRAKIDVTSPNINLRDPVIYRILKAHHHRTGDDWCIYPMYDFAHGQSDSIECITHSICTLEFEDHRPLYDWFIDALEIHHPQQIEFARLNINYTVMSKRKMMELVSENIVTGWDDPRMLTLCGMRRRGYTPKSIRTLCARVGVTKFNSLTDIGLLEHALREDLNVIAPRAMAVLNPLRVVIENYPEDQTEELDAVNNPQDESMGTRKVPFSRVIYVEHDDYMEDAPRKFFRLTVGREVRLRYAYFITCQSVIKDEKTGKVVELKCTYDPATRGGDSPDGRKVKGTIHWVSADHAVDAEVRLYDRLFTDPEPGSGKDAKDYHDYINPDSLRVLKNCKLEPSLAKAEHGAQFQFERLGYFCVDRDSSADAIVFNRTVALRDSWGKADKTSNKKTK